MTSRPDPVFFATGTQAYLDPVFRIEGLMSIGIGSIHYSNIDVGGAFGWGRVSEIDQSLFIAPDGKIVFRDEDCISVIFERPRLNSGQHPSRCDTARRLLLFQEGDLSYTIKEGGILRRFQRHSEGIWQVSRIEDRNGSAFIFERSASGRLEALVTPEHLRIVFCYDGDGLRIGARLIGAAGAEREIMRWTYDGARRMIQAESRFGAKCRYGYDEMNRLTSTSTSDGYTAEREYDGRGRVTALRTSGPYDRDRFLYDDTRRITTYLPGGEAGAAIEFHRNEDDLIVKEVNALGVEKRFVHAANGNMEAEVDGNGNRVRYLYDEDGNLAAWSDPEGRTSRAVWDGDRNLERLTDGEGGTWHYGRDGKGNLVSIQDPLGFRTDVVNDAAGRPTAIMRHDGLIERRVYDEHHRLEEMIDFRGGRTAFKRDGFGRVAAITDPAGATTRLSYDDGVGSGFWSAARLERPDGVALSLTTPDRGRTMVVRDGEGRAQTVRSGPCGVLAEVEGPTGARVRYIHDGCLRLSGVTNQNGRTWTFERDVVGRVVRECDVDGLAVEYAYDDADRRVETRYVDGTRIAHTYDRSGLLIRDEMHEPGRTPPRVTTFGYDRRGLVVSAQNDDAAVLFERDGIGRIIAESVNGRRVENTFDCCGNRTSRRIGGSLTAYAYDPLGRLQSLAADGHDPLVFTRDPVGRELTRCQARGFRLDQTWDVAGQLVRQNVPDVGAGRFAGSLTNGVSRTYLWTQAATPRTISDSGWGTTTYDYDANGQVLQASFGDGGMERYQYDPALNVIASAGQSPGDPATGGALVSWTATRGGRVETGRGPRGEELILVHDARGRVVERRVTQRGLPPRTWRYRWDGRDRMIACTTPAGRSWTYGYDAFARRIWKRCAGEGGTHGVTGRAYLWDRDTVGQEARIVGGAADWADAVTWHFEPATFVPLACEEGGKLSNVVVDHLGTPRELFDESGRLLLSKERHLWGASRRIQVEVKVPDPESIGASPSPDDRYELQLDFQGQSDDPETGLKYNRFRHYDPLATQYAATDPAGISGGLRPHGYVHAPTVWVDPSGLYGVYLFETTLNQCYVGKGEPSRMAQSMNYRTKAPPSKIKRCLYTNTDADAAKAGVDPKNYGALVENRLLAPSGYGAAANPDFLNSQFSGQSLYGASSLATQQAATATAAGIQSTFGPCP